MLDVFPELGLQIYITIENSNGAQHMGGGGSLGPFKCHFPGPHAYVLALNVSGHDGPKYQRIVRLMSKPHSCNSRPEKCADLFSCHNSNSDPGNSCPKSAPNEVLTSEIAGRRQLITISRRHDAGNLIHTRQECHRKLLGPAAIHYLYPQKPLRFPATRTRR